MWFLNLITIVLLISFAISEDYYELLGISKDADNREIRRAFKKLALKLHPDKNMADDKAHEKFITINKAYEVLKDEDQRKQYDLYGEDGLKKDFGNSWKGNYRSWNYYYESFGIYDEDPEIITLTRNDFVQSVLESDDLWFINFYSPQCSHCHHLAPAWREMARNFQDVLRIGAVNCEEEWMLCRQQKVYSYPTLIFYPKKEKYTGSRDAGDLMEYVLKQLPNNVIPLFTEDFYDTLFKEKYSSRPWLIFTCLNSDGCMDSDEILKLGVILDGLANVAFIDKKDVKICNTLECDPQAVFYISINSSVPITKSESIAVDAIEVQDIVKCVLDLLPEPEEFSDESFTNMQASLKDLVSSPRLVYFYENKEKSLDPKIDLKRLGASLSFKMLGQFNCRRFPFVCSDLHIHKLPSFILFKPGGFYEFHYGRITVYDVTKFTKEALPSQVQTLTPNMFPEVATSQQPWFIDFFAPWCPACMELLPEWRKASDISGHFVKFGTVDCSVHVALCRKYNINSYPTAILYNRSIGHLFHGSHDHQELTEFVHDIMHPVVQILSPDSYENIVMKKKEEDIWVIDFILPWCNPCQKLSPQWRRLAKMMQNEPLVQIGEINCQTHSSFCMNLGIQDYPTIRLFPKWESNKPKIFHSYNGNRNAESLQAWIYDFLPSLVASLNSATFKDVLSDKTPWLVDFYAPWCHHCHVFAPEFKKLAQALEGEVKTGKVDCVRHPSVCDSASVRVYPTILFYAGKEGSKPQNPRGKEIQLYTKNGILSFLKNNLFLKDKNRKMKDEL